MITFLTPGAINIRAITTFGVSVKDESAIGRFGTGFKYGVAIILRLGGSVTIHSPEGVYRFATLAEDIRGKEFQIVTMNDQPLGFTTETGRDGTAREAYREIASNTRDEEGRIVPGHVEQSGWTAIVVDCPEFEAWHDEADQIFLPPLVEPSSSRSNVTFYLRPSNIVYMKGVAVYDQPKEFCFTYNFTSGLTLSEDRKLSSPYLLNLAIANVLVDLDEDAFDHLCRARGTYEHEFELAAYTSRKGTTIEHIRRRVERGIALPEKMRRYFYKVDLEFADKTQNTSIKPSRIQQQKLDRCIHFLESCGYAIRDYPVIVTDKLGDNIKGQARSGKIYINIEALNGSTDDLAHTLIEEFIHLRYNLDDCSFGMQEFLFRRLIHTMQEWKGESL